MSPAINPLESYQCQICGIKFRTKAAANAHLSTEHSVRQDAYRFHLKNIQGGTHNG